MLKVFFLLILIFVSLSSKELIQPIPKKLEYNEKKALLGKKLYFETRLSSDGTLSCETCHNLYWNFTGTDGKTTSTGVKDRKGKLNTPTVLNAIFNFRQFHDGSVKSLKDQVIHPLTNPLEMDNTPSVIIKRLKEDPDYQSDFAAIYKEGITMENITDAIVEFQKTLITPDSGFDRYLNGDEYAISDKAKQGYENFKALGCISCHNGINIGGNLFQKLGVFKEMQGLKNLGRYNYTKKEKDKYFFKVPTLRNISKTAPYFYNGEQKSLKAVISIMAHYQLGREITNDELESIYAFLLTLDGKKPDILNED